MGKGPLKPRLPRRNRRARRSSGARWIAAAVLAAAAWWFWRSGGWHRWFGRHPNAIILHHSASAPWVDGKRIDAAAIDAMHARRGFRTVYQGKSYHIGYHYVILPGGVVQPGRPEGCVGAHAYRYNDKSLGICMVGDFSSARESGYPGRGSRPTPAQMRALVRLCARLARTYHIPIENVRCHRDVARTACPGENFPYAAFLRDLASELRTHPGD